MTPTEFRLFGGLEDAVRQVMDLRQAQLGLIAGNLANAETPGYRAKELVFADVLADVVRQAEQGDALAAKRVEITEREPVDWALDGNSVSPEHESAKLVENKLVYEALATGVSRHLSLLRYAASDGKA
jgi:flagellar basal-body rod protein FlgB